MPLRFAVQSITWGRASLGSMLDEIRAAGYEGVELFQNPQTLGGASVIEKAFHDSGLQLVGVASGSFDERCRLVREWAEIRNLSVSHPSVPYVYVDEWRDSDLRFVDRLNEGFRIGLHPHMYKPVQTVQEAKSLLKEHKKLGFIPDTAHLQIAGDDPAAAIRDPELSARLTAIHLKDWNDDVGRSFQFYARGFCELGEGDVPLQPVLQEILDSQFSGWLVVEQDSSTAPRESAALSLEWLKATLLRLQTVEAAT